MSRKNEAEIILEHDIRVIFGPKAYFTEFKFSPTRRYRFDVAVPDRKLGFEINGGLFIKGKSGFGGAHSLPTNILRDMEKRNLAGELGYRVFEWTPNQIKKGQHFSTLEILRREVP
jgi:hypothetical protein